VSQGNFKIRRGILRKCVVLLFMVVSILFGLLPGISPKVQASTFPVPYYFANWAGPIYSYLAENPDGTKTVFETVQANDVGSVAAKIGQVSVYAQNDRLLSTKKLGYELPLFGAFYFGKDYNYAAFGDTNIEQNDSKEVIRIVKYDKQFNRLGSVSVYGGDWIMKEPFYAGSPKFAEDGNMLILHTSRLRYTSSDGLNHQSNFTVIVDTEAMKVTMASEPFSGNYVSHSFNQFILFDGGLPVFLDHGDTYPRAVVLNKGFMPYYQQIAPDGPTGEYYSSYSKVNLFPISGTVGDNYTGVSVGGFEASDTSFIAAIKTVDQSKTVQNEGSKNQCDIVLCVVPKDSLNDSDVKQIIVGKCVGTDKITSAPYLVRLSGDRLAVVWQEFSTNNTHTRGDMVCVIVNGKGEEVGTAQHFPNMILTDCPPVLDSVGNIIWYSDNDEAADSLGSRKFYSITPLTDTTAGNELTASATSSAVLINGKSISFDAYNIDGSNYFKLRDLAVALNSTNKQFSVNWDGATNIASLISGEPYIGEMSQKGASTVKPVLSNATLLIDGKKVSLTAYNIGDFNYLKLRDFGEALDFGVAWDGATNTIRIDTTTGYSD